MLLSALASPAVAMQHNRNTTRISQCPTTNRASSLYMISMGTTTNQNQNKQCSNQPPTGAAVVGYSSWEAA